MDSSDVAAFESIAGDLLADSATSWPMRLTRERRESDEHVSACRLIGA
jgi:hypothetical protein